MRPVWLATVTVLGCVAAGCGGATDGISCDARCIPHNARRLVSRSPVPKTCLLASSGTWQIASMNFLTGDLGWIMARDIAPNGALTA